MLRRVMARKWSWVLGGTQGVRGHNCSEYVFKEWLSRWLMVTNANFFFPVVFPVVMYGCESWTIKKPEH